MTTVVIVVALVVVAVVALLAFTRGRTGGASLQGPPPAMPRPSVAPSGAARTGGSLPHFGTGEARAVATSVGRSPGGQGS